MTVLGSVDMQFVDSSAYTWIVYADDALGTNLSESPVNKAYIGIAYNKKTNVSSTNPTDYLWSKVTGDSIQGPAGADGQSLYTWIKYADDANGTNMNDSPIGKLYMGVAYNQSSQNESTIPTDYAWSLIKGDDAWHVEIVSSNGNIFKSGNINTVLNAVVYKGGVDVTSSTPIEKFKWTRVSEDPTGDTAWNSNYFGGTKSVTVTTQDVYRKATFFCEIIQ